MSGRDIMQCIRERRMSVKALRNGHDATVTPRAALVFNSVDEAFEFITKDLETHALKKSNGGYISDEV